MKLKKRRRNLGEMVTRKEAIRNFCFECMGYSHADVSECTAPECWLFPFRQGSVNDEEFEEEKKLEKEEKEKGSANERVKEVDEVDEVDEQDDKGED